MKIKKITAFYFLIFLIITLCAAKAQVTDTIKLEGLVFSKKTNKPVAYASVYIKDRPIGTITNNEGAYRLYIGKEYASDTLIISAIGFRNIEIPLKKYNERYQTLFLKETVYNIDEVMVKPESAEYIIKKAIKNFDRNYSVSPYGMNGFYRTTFKENAVYDLLLEASVYVYDEGFNKRYGQIVNYEHLRRSNDYRSYKYYTADQFLVGSLRFDRVRNRRGFMRNPSGWIFKRDTTMMLDKDVVYVIDASRKNKTVSSGAPYTYAAKIYVRKKDYGILQVNYAMDFKRTTPKEFPLVPETDTTYVKYNFCRMRYKYQDYKGLMYPKYLSWHIGYEIYDKRTGHLIVKDQIDEETIILNIITKNPEKLSRKNHIENLYTKVGKYDKKFWDNYNKPVDTKLIRQVKSDLNKRQDLEIQFSHNAR